MSDFTMPMSCDAFDAHLADYLEGDASEPVAGAMATHASECASCGALLADLEALPTQAAALPPLQPSRDLWAGIAERIDARVLPLDVPRTARGVAARRRWIRPAAAAAALVILTAGITYQLTRTFTASVGGPAVAVRPAAPVAPGVTGTRVAQAAPATPEEAPTSGSRSGGEPAESPTTRHTVRAPSSFERVAAGPRAPTATRQRTASTLRLASTDPLGEAEPVYDREIAKLRTIVRQRRTQLDPATVAVLEQSIAVIDSAIVQSRAALAKDPASGFLATQLNHSLEKKVELLRTAALLPSRT